MGQQQEIIFVTGKGGVGKSAVAAGIALAKANAGQSTLLVELGHQSFYQDYFGLENIAYQPRALKPNLDVALWAGPESLREYALHLIKVEALYRLFFENPVSKALINIAPALSELAILGKITSGYRKVGPALNYDCLVIDAYATGHLLALLRAPLGMAEVVRFGPMAEQTKAIFEIICDPSKTKFYVVSLPEELPVLEAIELSDGITQIIKTQPTHILNKVIEIPKDFKKGTDVISFEEYVSNTQERQNWALSKFNSHHITPLTLPFVPVIESWQVVEKLSLELSKC